jgi:hypothetical protein
MRIRAGPRHKIYHQNPDPNIGIGEQVMKSQGAKH